MEQATHTRQQLAAGHKGAVALGMRTGRVQRPPRRRHLAYGVAARHLKSAKVGLAWTAWQTQEEAVRQDKRPRPMMVGVAACVGGVPVGARAVPFLAGTDCAQDGAVGASLGR